MIQHVALIMDGNRRWAKEKKLPSIIGHQKGYKQIEKIIEQAQKHGISHITFWAFSTENWKRSNEEVDYLMNLFRKVFRSKLPERLLKKGGKICVLGDVSVFPKDIQKEITRIVEASKNNTVIQINIALNYGGRDEILHAVRQIVSEKIDAQEVNQDLLSRYLYTKSQPDPDLIIRTGGAQRLSGYMAWQSAYSELYFTDTYWPDFGEKDFEKAIEEYKRRERRFGE